MHHSARDAHLSLSIPFLKLETAVHTNEPDHVLIKLPQLDLIQQQAEYSTEYKEHNGEASFKSC